MQIARDLYEQLVEHALEDRPAECCGVVGAEVDEAGRPLRAVTVRRATNAVPERRKPLMYSIGPAELFAINAELEDAGLEVGAIYHSHTRSDPIPSETDINLAMYPDALYVIVGVKGDEPDVRAWTIRDGAYAPAELEVTG